MLEETPLLIQEHFHGNTARGSIGAYEIAKIAYREEGSAVFFRGLGVCSIRAFIVNAVQVCINLSFRGNAFVDMNSGRSMNGSCVLSDRRDYKPSLKIKRCNIAWHKSQVLRRCIVQFSDR